MKEPEQHFSPESIDQQTERFFSELPTRDSRLIADLYQTYAPSREENNRSLQRIWSRFAQEQEGPGSKELSEGTRDVNAHAGRPDAPIPGSFQQPPRPLPRRSRRSLWKRLSAGLAVAAVLLIILSWVLLTHVFLGSNTQSALGASLTLGGGPQINQNIVFLVKSSEAGHYLAEISFATYDGHTWRNSAVSSSQLPANRRMVMATEGSLVHLVTQQVRVVNLPGEQQPYIIGAGQIANVDQPTTLLFNKTTGSQIAVLLNNSRPLAAGERYTVQSYVSSADIKELRSIPLPADAPTLPPYYDGQLPSTYYNPAILHAYLQLPPHLDPRILTLAKQITVDAPTMYDKAEALEAYLRANYKYDINVGVPPGQEATSWFLFHSGNKGFCNYFATAMTIMARELGIPARVVSGYTNGTYDAQQHQWVIRGNDAHSWVQVYFAGYGWIDFEPSASFSPLTHLL